VGHFCVEINTMWLELIGGTLLILGLFVRPVAFILSGEMAFAYFMAHASAANFWLPLQNRGESAALFCFIFLYLAVAGGGACALDARRGGQHCSARRTALGGARMQ